MELRKFKAIVGHIASLVSATFLMVWGVFNATIALNVFFRQGEEISSTTADWVAMFSLAFLLGVVPFLCGCALLYRTMMTTQK